jgi:hypothetical protein
VLNPQRLPCRSYQSSLVSKMHFAPRKYFALTARYWCFPLAAPAACAHRTF